MEIMQRALIARGFCVANIATSQVLVFKTKEMLLARCSSILPSLENSLIYPPKTISEVKTNCQVNL